MIDVNKVDFEKGGGLVPAIVQDAATRQVLMLGYMNREALEHTLATGGVTFWSRSRQSLWRKGETSGNTLQLETVRHDCDADALLVLVTPAGPTCHTGAVSCFGGGLGVGQIGQLWRRVERRAVERPVGSYTTELLDSGTDRCAQKVGEEGVEVVIAAKNDDDDALAGECADLVYHLLVLLAGRGLGLGPVLGVLEEREARSAASYETDVSEAAG